MGLAETQTQTRIVPRPFCLSFRLHDMIIFDDCIIFVEQKPPEETPEHFLRHIHHCALLSFSGQGCSDDWALYVPTSLLEQDGGGQQTGRRSKRTSERGQHQNSSSNSRVQTARQTRQHRDRSLDSPRALLGGARSATHLSLVATPVPRRDTPALVATHLSLVTTHLPLVATHLSLVASPLRRRGIHTTLLARCSCELKAQLERIRLIASGGRIFGM